MNITQFVKTLFLKKKTQSENKKLSRYLSNVILNSNSMEANLIQKCNELTKRAERAEKEVTNLKSIMEKYKKENTNSQSEDVATNFKLLEMAIKSNEKEICMKIMDKFQDRNPRYVGVTALHIAAKWGQNEIFRFILDQIEDKNPKDFNRTTPLHIGL